MKVRTLWSGPPMRGASVSPSDEELRVYLELLLHTQKTLLILRFCLIFRAFLVGMGLVSLMTNSLEVIGVWLGMLLAEVILESTYRWTRLRSAAALCRSIQEEE